VLLLQYGKHETANSVMDSNRMLGISVVFLILSRNIGGLMLVDQQLNRDSTLGISMPRCEHYPLWLEPLYIDYV
jgi:hypothetical protein